MAKPRKEPGCEGDDCLFITYETSDPRADRFDADFATGPVPFPPEGDQAFDFPPFPELRAAALREYNNDRFRYENKSKGCREGCECSASDDPADVKTSTFRRTFSFQEDAAGFNGVVITWTVYASYQVKASKTLGFCVLQGGSRQASLGPSGIDYASLLQDAADRVKYPGAGEPKGV